MLSCLLSNKENKVVSLSKEKNEDELISWKIPNVLFPLSVIVFSIISYVLFGNDLKLKSLFNLLINGSVLMASFNRMSSMLNYISKIELKKENAKKLGINVKNVKMKVIGYSFILILFIASFYSYQVINKPFESNGVIFLQIVISGLFFWWAIDATKIAFFLQEAFLTNTYLLSFELEQQSLKETPEDNDIKF
jgi:hypothetical protein